jgi:hypothetical protein
VKPESLVSIEDVYEYVVEFCVKAVAGMQSNPSVTNKEIERSHFSLFIQELLEVGNDRYSIEVVSL